MDNHAVRQKTRRSTRLGGAALVAATCLVTIGSSFFAADAGAPTSAPAQRITSAVREPDPVAAVAAIALSDLQSYSLTLDTTTFAEYAALREQIATTLADRLALDPARLIAAWQLADVAHQTALMAAFSQVGVPYRRNTSKPGEGFDCSGLTTYAWGVAGTTLTRQSGSQITSAAARTKLTAQAGDLVYYPGHVMLYLGVDDAIVHAPYTGRTVEVDMASRRRSVRFGNPLG